MYLFSYVSWCMDLEMGIWDQGHSLMVWDIVRIVFLFLLLSFPSLYSGMALFVIATHHGYILGWKGRGRGLGHFAFKPCWLFFIIVVYTPSTGNHRHGSSTCILFGAGKLHMIKNCND